MGHRDPGIGGRSDARRYPWHDLELDRGVAEYLGLLAPAPEDERVTTLEADDAAPGTRPGDDQPSDLVLPDRARPGLLADVDQLRVGAGRGERARGNQAVMDDHVGGCDQLQRAHRHQARVAGTRADQVGDPGAGAGAAHDRASALARSSSSPAPAPSIRSASDSPSAAGWAGSPATRSRIHSLPSGMPA